MARRRRFRFRPIDANAVIMLPYLPYVTPLTTWYDVSTTDIGPAPTLSRVLAFELEGGAANNLSIVRDVLTTMLSNVEELLEAVPPRFN